MFMSPKKLDLKIQDLKEGVYHFFRPETNDQIKRLQFFWVGCGVTGLLILSYGLVTFLYSSGPLQKADTPKLESVMIESALDKVDLHDAWRHRIEDSLDQFSQKIAALEKLLTEGIKRGDMAASSESPQAADMSQVSEEDGIANSLESSVLQETGQQAVDSPQIQELRGKLFQLETRLAEKGPYDPSSFGSPRDMGAHNPNQQPEGNPIQKVTLGLTEDSHHKLQHTVETTIPAGAFAKTVLLSGLDASSAMSASSDPRPMLLRIIDHGTLPRRFQSDLKDCHCTAGAYGDLSSERVYARLEKLTCVEQKTGEIIETQVAGYVAGSDGKAGIRGVVASKDGQFLARSLMGGIFSGLSNVANPQNRRAQVNPFVGGGAVGSSVTGPSIGENFTAGMAGGATTALDRLSQYYIDRAEQLQPVIQIAAGQVVDIVFTEGTFIGSQSIRSELETTRDEPCKGDACVQNHQPTTH